METEEKQRAVFYDNLSKAGLIFGTFYNEFQKLPLEVQNKPFGEIKKHLKQNPDKYDFKIEKSLLPELKNEIKKLIENGKRINGRLCFNPLLFLLAINERPFRKLLLEKLGAYALSKARRFKYSEIEAGDIFEFILSELNKFKKVKEVKKQSEKIGNFLPPYILTRCQIMVANKIKEFYRERKNISLNSLVGDDGAELGDFIAEDGKNSLEAGKSKQRPTTNDGPVRIEKVAQDMGVSVKSIRRYIKQLREKGTEVPMDECHSMFRKKPNLVYNFSDPAIIEKLKKIKKLNIQKRAHKPITQNPPLKPQI